LEQRYTKYLQSVEKKLDGTAADAATTTQNRNLELYEMAAKLAKKIFNLKCKGSTLVMRWRKDKQDIEVITGYAPPPPSSSLDRRIQMPEYEEEGEDIETEPTSDSSPESVENTSRERTTHGI
jgi:hypothetical protein